MEKHSNMVPFLLGAILVVALATFVASFYLHERVESKDVGAEFLAGDTQSSVYSFFANDNGTFTGEAAFSFTPGYTYPVETRYTTEHALWVNCSNVNVSGLFYEVSSDNKQWARGAVAITPCFNNGSRYELTDKAFQYIRLNVSAHNGTVGQLPNSSSRLKIAISGK